MQGFGASISWRSVALTVASLWRLFEVVFTLPKQQAGTSRAEQKRYKTFRAHSEKHAQEEPAQRVRWSVGVAPATAGPHRLLLWKNGRVDELRYPQHRGGLYHPGSIEFYEQELHTEPVPV